MLYASFMKSDSPFYPRKRLVLLRAPSKCMGMKIGFISKPILLILSSLSACVTFQSIFVLLSSFLSFLSFVLSSLNKQCQVIEDQSQSVPLRYSMHRHLHVHTDHASHYCRFLHDSHVLNLNPHWRTLIIKSQKHTQNMSMLH